MDSSDQNIKYTSWLWSFYRCILVSTKNVKAQRVLKSTEAIRLERNRQLQGNYHTIHPFSDFRILWDFFMVLNIYTITLLESLMLTFEQKTIVGSGMTNVKWIIYIFNIILFVDIILNFFTGYYDKETKSVKLNVRDIAKKYIKTKFWIHIVFSIPWYFIASTYERFTGFNQQTHGDYDLRDYFSIISITRVLRYGEIDEFLSTYENCSIKYKTFWKIINLLVYITTLYHFGACVLLNVFSLTEVDPYRKSTQRSVESWVVSHHFFSKYIGSVTQKYIRCLYRATNTLLLHGNGVEHNNSDIDRNVTIVYRIVGLAHLLYLVGNMTLIVRLMYTDVRRLQTLTQYITEMARHKKLPQRTIKRMHEYFKFKCDAKFFNETKLVGMLSTKLQKEIRFHCSKALVEVVPMFKCLPIRVLEQMVFRLHTDVFLPGDVIIKSGITGNAMYFLTFGKIAVKREGARDIEIRDGAHFGWKNLLSEEEVAKEGDVVAVEPSEVQVLRKEDFWQVMEPHPDLLMQMQQIFEENCESIIF